MDDFKIKYCEALERAREFYNNEECRVGMTPVDLEVIFPELRESENDGNVSTCDGSNYEKLYKEALERVMGSGVIG